MSGILTEAAVRVWVDAFAASCEASWEELGELDRQSGDGDFGENLRAAMEHVRTGLAEKPGGSSASLFSVLSTSFMRTGGTSGTLFGVWFRELSKATSESSEVDLAALARGVAAGSATVERLGGASVGDKTMVDAMRPAASALIAADDAGASLRVALEAAAGAAHDGARSTSALVARRGRASYVGEVGRGVVDPGAAAIALFFQCGRDSIQSPQVD